MAFIIDVAEGCRTAMKTRPVVLPPLPSVAAQILRLSANPDVHFNEVATLIERDPNVTAAVLGTANSALYGSVTLDNVRDAVVRLGVRTVADLAAAASMRGLFETRSDPRLPLHMLRWAQLSQHALTCALVLSSESQRHRIGTSDRAFLTGMLHDFGRTSALLVVGNLLTREEIPALSPAVLDGVLEELHVDLGVEFATHWNLPPRVIDIIRDHHSPNVQDSEIALLRLVSGLDELRMNPHHRAGLSAEVRAAAVVLSVDSRGARVLWQQLKDTSASVRSLL